MMLMSVLFRLLQARFFFRSQYLVQDMQSSELLKSKSDPVPDPSELKTNNYCSPIVRFKFFHPGFLHHLFELLSLNVSVGIVIE